MDRRYHHRNMMPRFPILVSGIVFASRFESAAAWSSSSLGVRSGVARRTLVAPERRRSFEGDKNRAGASRLSESGAEAFNDGFGEDADQKTSLALLIWKFSRPHTLIGSAVAIPTLHCLAAPHLNSVFTLKALSSIGVSIIPALLINIYVTGLNQITDVDIDKINKPNLPIPAGLLSVADAKLIVSACLFFGLLAGALVGTTGLNLALWGSVVLGTLYSMPPFRLKRFPLLAAACIVAVRGTIINVGFFAHAQQFAFGNPMGIVQTLLTDKKCILSSLFYGIFGIVIALMKDVPDVAGDARANIRSFSVKVGQKTIFNSARRLLSFLLYGFGIGFLTRIASAPSLSITACRALVGSTSIIAGFRVFQRSVGVDPEDSGQVYNYYMYLWKIFYLSYIALPFVK